MFGIKLMAGGSVASTLLGAATVVDSGTLVPLGLLVAGVVAAVTLGVRVGVHVQKQRDENERLRRRVVRLERKSGLTPPAELLEDGEP